jgi:hypothetical protein
MNDGGDHRRDFQASEWQQRAQGQIPPLLRWSQCLLLKKAPDAVILSAARNLSSKKARKRGIPHRCPRFARDKPFFGAELVEVELVKVL